MAISARDAQQILGAMRNANAKVWVDGGWGIDALIGEQSREHDDLDLVIPWPCIEPAIAALGDLGFKIVKDERPCSFVMGDADDRRVDIHPVGMDEEGGGLQAQPDGKPPWRYSPQGLAGSGKIGGMRVACLSADEQVRCHSGYELDEGDRADLRLLRARLGVALLLGQE